MATAMKDTNIQLGIGLHSSDCDLNLDHLEQSLSMLTHPKRSVRIDSHSSLSSSLSFFPSHGFASDNYVTLLFHCLHCINNGARKKPKVSKPEIRLSLRLVSLLVLNLVAGGDDAHQVFDESLPVLSRALVHFESSGSDFDIVVDILDCLSFVGFFGSTRPEETQSVMLMIWDSFTKNGDKWSDLVRIKAIYAWTFLLSSMPGSHVSNKYWKTMTSYFLTLMGDDGVALAVADALLLIVEMAVFNKFQEQVEQECCGDTIKDQITEKIDKDREKRLQLYADEHDDENADEDDDEDDDADGRTIQIAQQVEDGLILSKVSEIIQSKFIRSFLGPQGFAFYLQYNNNLQNMFKFTQKDDESEKDKLLMPEREEIIVRFYCPPNKRKGHRYDKLLAFMSRREKQVRKRMTKSPCSAGNRARSQLLKKQRENRSGVVSGSVFDF